MEITITHAIIAYIVGCVLGYIGGATIERMINKRKTKRENELRAMYDIRLIGKFGHSARLADELKYIRKQIYGGNNLS